MIYVLFHLFYLEMALYARREPKKKKITPVCSPIVANNNITLPLYFYFQLFFKKKKKTSLLTLFGIHIHEVLPLLTKQDEDGRN